MPNLVGTGLNQVPTNGMLGGLAYQSPDHASIKDLDLKNLSQINSEIANTAVDIFIYDTSKDSDGGAWRKRTQHTSWYNETLGTATRGTRKEFPAVAVIVATAASTRRRLIIYDGDDPDLSMWMVVDSTDSQWHQTETASPVYALNGIIALGSSSDGQPIYVTRNRLDLFNFISDKIEGSTNSAQYAGVIEGIVNRSDVAVINKMYGSNPYSLVNYRINDVAMTVLPNAPIDPATGLPVPTIACLVGETQVTLENGETKRIDKIKVGEVVKTLEGNHKVLNWFDQGIKETIELEFDDGTKLVCTPDHKIRTTIGWIEAGDLNEEHEIVSL